MSRKRQHDIIEEPVDLPTVIGIPTPDKTAEELIDEHLEEGEIPPYLQDELSMDDMEKLRDELRNIALNNPQVDFKKTPDSLKLIDEIPPEELKHVYNSVLVQLQQALDTPSLKMLLKSVGSVVPYVESDFGDQLASDPVLINSFAQLISVKIGSIPLVWRTLMLLGFKTISSISSVVNSAKKAKVDVTTSSHSTI